MTIDVNTLKIPDMVCLKTSLICLVLVASVKRSQVSMRHEFTFTKVNKDLCHSYLITFQKV